ncbi:MAG: hypothetical protein U0X76_08145 [Bacteroidia bacterium]
MKKINHTVRMNHESHLRWLIAGSFFVSIVAAFLSWLFPPDFTKDPPDFPLPGLLFGQLQTALIILGSTALGIKITEEKRILPAIGFTMLAISYGVIFVLYLVSSSKESIEETYKLFGASLFLLIPSALLIARYSNFPKWVNVLTALYYVPWIIEVVLFFSNGNKATEIGGAIDFIGQLTFNVVVFAWGIITLKRKTTV